MFGKSCSHSIFLKLYVCWGLEGERNLLGQNRDVRSFLFLILRQKGEKRALIGGTSRWIR